MKSYKYVLWPPPLRSLWKASRRRLSQRILCWLSESWNLLDNFQGICLNITSCYPAVSINLVNSWKALRKVPGMQIHFICYCPHNDFMGQIHYFPYFTGEETETQKCTVSWGHIATNQGSQIKTHVQGFLLQSLVQVHREAGLRTFITAFFFSVA